MEEVSYQSEGEEKQENEEEKETEDPEAAALAEYENLMSQINDEKVQRELLQQKISELKDKMASYDYTLNEEDNDLKNKWLRIDQRNLLGSGSNWMTHCDY